MELAQLMLLLNKP